MIAAKEKAVTRPASYDCKYVESLGRIATRKLYHKISRLVKPLFAIIIIACVVYAVISAITVRYPEYEPIEYKVTYGDTLWSIAKEYKPDGVTMDSYMGWVYEHNKGGLIRPGDIVVMGKVK